MLISLDWLRDSVDLPRDLDPLELAERFTCTTAEVDEVKRVQVGAVGLIAARVERVTELPETRNLKLVQLDVGAGRIVETVTAAPVLHVGEGVVFAPPGASVKALGQIGEAKVAGRQSVGMILPGDALGIEMSAGEAVFLDARVPPGQPLAAELFDDWLLEVDNKSITHRPDLWGHRGIAREVAAICGVELKPYPVAPLEELTQVEGPEIPLVIEDASAARRYSGLRFASVPTQPGPLWMQLRLGRVGMRPISALVDLTNYVMADLGQPMHAFDGARVARIEVAWASEGEVFRTLDGMERKLPPRALMIKAEGKSIALAGIMGGLETEISKDTTSLLLEAANFDAATVRRSAVALGMRTDASARFEKSLDPVNTVLSIQRFLHLAHESYPDLTLTSPLSDCYPNPFPEVSVSVERRRVAGTIGREVPDDEVQRLLTPLGFVVDTTESGLKVQVPSFRATGDVSIAADVIEEIARCSGYNNIPEVMPQATIRKLEKNALHEVERQALEHFTTVRRFNEIHGYLWYDAAWLSELGFVPGACVELKNPAAAGLHQLRQTLLSGLLAAVGRNRFHCDELSILELGGVFERAEPEDQEYRHLGLIRALRQKRADDKVYHELKSSLAGWIWQSFGREVTFAPAEARATHPWEQPQWTAVVQLGDRDVGRISVVPPELKRKMDEHLAAWSLGWVELRLSGLEDLGRRTEQLGAISAFPCVETDFSVLVPRSTRYREVLNQLARFEHPLLKMVRYVGSYEGSSIQEDQRSLTFRAVIGDDTRTLVDDDSTAFRGAFEGHLASCGYEIRR